MDDVRTPRRGSAASAFTELAQLVRTRGLLRRRYGYYWTKLFSAPLAVAGCLVVFVRVGDSWWQLFTAAALAIVFTQIAFLGHDAAHRQIFVSGRWNDWISIVLGDLLVGMSYGWWQHKHTRHHANPNKLGSDPDIELPVVAVSAKTAAKHHSPPIGWLRAHQGVLFFPLLLLEGLSLHASSVRRVFARGRLERRWAEIVFLAIRMIGYVALVFVVLSPGIAFAFLGVQLGLFGFYMGIAFAPNHKGMPIVPREMTLDFLHRQVLMSRNIGGSRFLDTALGGLNYQIEHHLFPSMPRPHLRRAAPIVAEYCRAQGVTYTRVGLFASYAIVIRYINRVASANETSSPVRSSNNATVSDPVLLPLRSAADRHAKRRHRSPGHPVQSSSADHRAAPEESLCMRCRITSAVISRITVTIAVATNTALVPAKPLRMPGERTESLPIRKPDDVNPPSGRG